ncbi:phosphotransacetylase [Bacillus pakistanensis]|uniref:Phosphotransacetylase n=1 Tax=Rossellomorea pakistanensis TaxID=992288 RepID=A0ABS2NIG4_9BACI|nr:hypothetical protein [Bacillus pakistanensis]MBM7587637.1 phosphotransacetylase [Bacillus pakistanensis]
MSRAGTNPVVQAESKEQGLVQVSLAVESEEINTVLKQFHEEEKEITEVKPLDQKEQSGYVDRVYDIIYVENN